MPDQPTSGTLSPARFIAKWSRAALTERAASHEHFIDLCRLLGQPTPAQHDATGAEYAFEKGVAVSDSASRGSKGDFGYADVWWRNKFAWEYKRKDKYKDLADAYRQLCQYREALENPPLLVVCDIARTEIHTNFTGTASRVQTVLLKDMDSPESLSLLRRVFTDPASFCPTVTRQRVTENVAQHIATLARLLQSRGHAPLPTAHFLMKCMFCLFAEDVGLLPNDLFSRVLNQWHDDPAELTTRLTELFQKMRTGGAFGTDRVPWFNGGLFDTAPALPLEHGEIGVLRIASALDWGSVEPAIFGTLFERSLDPTQRAQIGAHYTGRDDILLIVEPVLMAPLRAQWSAVRRDVETQLDRRRTGKTAATKKKADQAIADSLQGFLAKLSGLRILDPACGSGNFLYVAIQQLLDLEKEVVTFAARPDIALGLFPTVRPTQLHGIELNPYAAELAQVVIWIGYLQWMRDNGFNTPSNPILETLQTIENRDAILDLSDPSHPAPARWPAADFIIGNPPFLGGNLIRQGLGDEYIESLFAAYDIPRFSDLCCYWFELARRAIEKTPTLRAGLLATQGIRGGANREVLARIKKAGNIFMAWSDRDWVLDGAAVHVSMVGFDNATEKEIVLDGAPVSSINEDLSTGLNFSNAHSLKENLAIQHEGDKKGGDFEIGWETARAMLAAPHVGDSPITRVLRPWFNGKELNDRFQGMWIVDFPPEMPMEEAAKFEASFKYVQENVGTKYAKSRAKWWIHERPRPAMRQAIGDLPRFIVTTRHSKHRLFGWVQGACLPDSAVIVFPRSDDYFFGVLHSSVHELWARRMGTQLREAESGFRYTPTTCFETFPMPWPPGAEGSTIPGNTGVSPVMAASSPSPATGETANGQDARSTPSASSSPPATGYGLPATLLASIADAARELNALRERWLNPPEWLDPLAAAVDASDSFSDVPASARPLLRHSAIMARAAKDPNLRTRTLTNLYNQRPTWLSLAHHALDVAVLSAYASVDPSGGWSSAWADLWRDTGAGQPLPADHPLAAQRAEVDQKVLANLLRLNRERGSV